MAIRKPPNWLTQTDERILEFLEKEVKASPMEMADSGLISKDNKYISQRLTVLLGADLVQKTARGVYRITDRGQGYLAGVEDLRDEPEPE